MSIPKEQFEPSKHIQTHRLPNLNAFTSIKGIFAPPLLAGADKWTNLFSRCLSIRDNNCLGSVDMGQTFRTTVVWSRRKRPASSGRKPNCWP